MPNLKSITFCRAVLDAIAENLCVIEGDGRIVFVNRRWNEFAEDNGGRGEQPARRANYLDTCDRAERAGDDDARKAAQGLRALISGRIEEFTLEYPCHSPTRQRWFVLAAQRLSMQYQHLFVIKHRDITDRKQAELEVQRLSLTDPLTGLANRLHFEQVVSREWRSHQREGSHLALLIVDLDHFKRLNDQHGHLAGDACLEELGRMLGRHARRPRDLAVRYGGEELVLVLCETELDDALRIAEDLRQEIADLRIPHGGRPALSLTASIGVTSRVPDATRDWKDWFETADQALYAAKREGRNRVCARTALETSDGGSGLNLAPRRRA